MIPTPGRIVLYTLSAQDAEVVKRQRQPWMRLQVGSANVSTAIHVGNTVYEGDIYPMIIVRTWGATPNSAVNGQVFLDGNDHLWVTSVAVGTGPHTFAWPVTSSNPFARIGEL
jgi:hypothetical protein